MHLHTFVERGSNPSGSYVGDIRGKSVQETPVKVVSTGSSGLGSKGAKGDLPSYVSNQKFIVAAEGNGHFPIAQPLLLPQYHWQQTSQNQVVFYQTSSRVVHAGPSIDMPQGLLPSVNNRQDLKGVFEFQGKISCMNSGKATDFNPTALRDTDATKPKPFMLAANNNNHEDLIITSGVFLSDQSDLPEEEYTDVPMGRQLSPHHVGGSQKKLISTQYQIYDQNHASTTPDTIEEGSNSSHPPAVTIAVPGLTSRQRDASRSKTANRIRRARISGGLKALQGLLPHSREANKEAVMDDIIDYIKYLQLQVKALSQSRLGGEAACDPFIHLEGFGHYLFHQQMRSEPLEEMIGRLMELNMSAVSHFLESKGLHLMPTSLAEGIFPTF